MAKKLLCVMLSVLMVVSLLPMGVMADDTVYYQFALAVQQTSGSWSGSWWTLNTEGNSDGSSEITVEWTDISALLTSNLVSGDSQLLFNNNAAELENITVTVSTYDGSNYTEYSSYTLSSVGEASGTSDGFLTSVDANLYNVLIASGTKISVTFTVVVPTSGTETTSRTNGVIYINEDYHGILLTRSLDGGETSKTYLACVPHTVASNGYCTVCHMYIGTDDEGSTITVDGVEYEAAFSNDVNFASNDWNTTTLGDESFVNALSTEGALLVITRDTETIVSYVSGEVWDKFFVGANYQYVYLSTVGTSTDDEDDLVAFLSDDGTTVVYDGATVYAALEAAGLTDSTSYTLGTNSSETYTITNVSVYVPVGTIVAEDVDVEEPVESTDTETEDDGDDLTVDDTDEVETPAETNPTTGVALALVPMAIAGFAVVSSKRR